MTALASPLSLETERRTVTDKDLSSPFVKFTLPTWMPGFFFWQPLNPMECTESYKQQPILFEVDTIDLPTAAGRWKLKSHPELTFDDLREGRYPKPTEQEKETRRKALRVAQEVREKIDIRPLTTSAIIRQLREDISEDCD